MKISRILIDIRQRHFKESSFINVRVCVWGCVLILFDKKQRKNRMKKKKYENVRLINSLIIIIIYMLFQGYLST